MKLIKLNLIAKKEGSPRPRLPGESRGPVKIDNSWIPAFAGDFLSHRDNELRLTRAAYNLAEPAFKKVWDNPEDDVYDKL